MFIFKWSRKSKTFENEHLEESKEDRRKDPFQIPLGKEYCMSPSSSSDDPNSWSDDDASFDDSWRDKDYKNPLNRNLGMELSCARMLSPRPLLMIHDNDDVNANGTMEREGIPPPPPPPPKLPSRGGIQPPPPPLPTPPLPPL